VRTHGALHPRPHAPCGLSCPRRVPRRGRAPSSRRRAPPRAGHCPNQNHSALRCITGRFTRRTPAMARFTVVPRRRAKALSSALARHCSALLSVKLWSRRSRVNAVSLSRCLLTGNDHAKTTAPCRVSLPRCGLRVLRPDVARDPKRLANRGAVNRSRASWRRAPRSRRQASCDANRRCSPNNRGSTTV